MKTDIDVDCAVGDERREEKRTNEGEGEEEHGRDRPLLFLHSLSFCFSLR